MNLEQIAQQAMDYLDSVGIAADYEVNEKSDYVLCVHTDIASHRFKYLASKHALRIIKNAYPQKSPS